MEISWFILITLGAAVICFFTGLVLGKNNQKEMMYPQMLQMKDNASFGKWISEVNLFGTRFPAKLIKVEPIKSKKAHISSYWITAEWFEPTARKLYTFRQQFTVNTRYVLSHKEPKEGDDVTVLHILGSNPQVSYIERPG